jgi:very-short-patch-repair endonuclease
MGGRTIGPVLLFCVYFLGIKMGKRWSLPQRSEEHRRKLSEAAKLRFKDPEYRRRHAEIRKGCVVPEERREKIRQTFARKWADPEQREIIRSHKIKAAQSIKRPTYPERRVALTLDSFAIPYRFQQRIGRFLVDFLIEPNIVIEVDGRYWHENRKESDAIRDRELKEQGYIVVRIPASQFCRGPAKDGLTKTMENCRHCGRPYYPLRKGLCAACSQYKRINGISRPLDGKFKTPRKSTGGNAGKIECMHGHKFDEKNTYIQSNGRRKCRACDAARQRTKREKNRRVD